MTRQKPIFIDPRLRRFEYTATQTSHFCSGFPPRTNLPTVAPEARLDSFETENTRHAVELLDIQSISSDETLSNASPSTGRGIQRPDCAHVPSRSSRQNGINRGFSCGISNKRPPVHSWIDSEKLFLLLLKRRFQVSGKDTAKILNKRFPNTVAPFASPMVQSYYAEMKRKTDDGVAKTSIRPLHIEEEERIIYEITRIARKCNVHLQLRFPRRERSNTHFLPENVVTDDEETSGDIIEPEDNMDIDQVGEPESDSLSVDTPLNTPGSQDGQSLTSINQTSRSRFFDPRPAYIQSFEEALSVHEEPEIHGLQTKGLPPLLFRMFDDIKAGINRPDYFKASKFAPLPEARRPTPPLEESTMFKWEVSLHMNRKGVGTPFISTTSSLLWAVHMAATSKSNDVASIGLSVIDTRAANEECGVYPASKLFSKAKKDPGFVEKKNRGYMASTEYLVWFQIPQPAIQKSIRYYDLEELANSDYGVRTILQLDKFKTSTSIAILRSKFMSDVVDLNTNRMLGFAKLLLFFGVTPLSDPKAIKTMTFSIVQGWCLGVPSALCAKDAFTGWKIYWAGITTPEVQAQEEVYAEAERAFVEGAMSGVKNNSENIKRPKHGRSQNGSGRKRRANVPDDLEGFIVN